MANPQPRAFSRSFEKVFTVIFVLIGLFLAFSFMPMLMAIGSYLVPVAVVAAAGYILWRTFSRY